jgi:type IV secretion system protein TrbL
MEIRTKRTSGLVIAYLVLAVVLAFLCVPSAHAELSSHNVIDNLLQKYQAAASGWETAILNEARWLFWQMALISLVITIAFVLLTRPEAVWAEIARWVLFTGVFYWALNYGPTFARGIISSMRIPGSTATGTGKEMDISSILDIGFKIFQKAVSQIGFWHAEASFLVGILAVVVLLMTAWICCNIIQLVCASWIVLEAGAIFLAFGGAAFFRDIALAYYRTILALGAALLTMELIIGLGASFLQSLVALMGDQANAREMGVLMIACVVLAVISQRVPNMVAGIIGGSHGVGHMGLMTALAFGAVAGKVVAGAAAESAAKASAKKAQPTLDAVRSGERAAAASLNGNGRQAMAQGGGGNGQRQSSSGRMP